MNSIIDEVASELKSVSAAEAYDTASSPKVVNHERCSRFEGGINGCMTYPCPDCDLNNPEYDKWKPGHGK